MAFLRFYGVFIRRPSTHRGGKESEVNMKGMMKWPLVIAAVLVVGRVALEQIGAPELNKVFGVVWLYFLVPVYFAVKIGSSGEAQPFKELFKSVALFAIYTRLMVMPTYCLAYMFQWTAPRFSLTRDRVVGEGVSPLDGYLIIPVRNALVWAAIATIVGAVIGSITLAIRRHAMVKGLAPFHFIVAFCLF